MKRPPHRHPCIRTEQQKKMLPQEDNRTACFGFYKNKNNVVSICLLWAWGDGITEICVAIKQIDAASGSICKTDNIDF